ncbi:phosphoinositide phosphatase SAC6-like isoform X2 [Hibiscus syriacus]|uniref:phosphoinositide phosphatase SAC6-like isoform X2 n=1 Tax=Hibiscus syriacus TaxID=106335 RepID=UPI0019204E4B|nr:phosphoinositide phosphatase SAC6-like isoform X2 [Hibiscus syriacus]
MKGKAEPFQKLCTRMRLWEFPDEFVIQPTDGSSTSSFSISLVDASMMLIDSIPEYSSIHVPKTQLIFGVVGMLKFVTGSYLFVVTDCKCVGSYLGHPIFKFISLKVLRCSHSVKHSPAEQKKVENEFSRLLKTAERTTGLYFSYDTTLTLSAQRLYDLGDESKMLPLWRQGEPRFLWNGYMLEALIDKELDPYLLPVVQGSFHNFQATIGKEIVDVTLIARRCTRRNGTRMWRRGADPEGYVANFVESEQIVQINGFTSSFVQVRGSIPFLWEQIVDLSYKPKLKIVRPGEAPQIAKRHFLDLRKMYGSVLAVDLVNKHGGEGRLSETFSNAMQPIVSEDLRYLHFDFTKICGHVHFERLSLLYEQAADFLVKNGYFLLNEKKEKMKEQLGVVRTNCIDCLDRTNITQTMIARKMLELQLRKIGVFAAEEIISSHPELDGSFRILWANHGDDISIQYSGTPALKGDIVRSGERRVQGVLTDRYISLKRYYLNNFSDGTKQDAIDLLQGHYIASMRRDMVPPSPTRGLEAVAVRFKHIQLLRFNCFILILLELSPCCHALFQWFIKQDRLMFSFSAVVSDSFMFGNDRIVLDNKVIGASWK